jgi:hypothetical protein
VALASAALVCAGLLGAMAGEHPTIDVQKGWKQLFNGKDLTGWATRDTDGNPQPADTWVVEDGTLTRKGKSYLWSMEQFGDFILDLEFKVGPRTNSGVILRHDPEYVKGKPYWYNGLLEFQILDSHGKEPPDMHDCGSLYDMIAPSKNTMKPAGEWNRATITCQGSKVVAVLNGATILDVDLSAWSKAKKNPDGTENKYNKPMKDLPRRGHILLQEHPGSIWFRNVYVKPLN